MSLWAVEILFSFVLFPKCILYVFYFLFVLWTVRYIGVLSTYSLLAFALFTHTHHKTDNAASVGIGRHETLYYSEQFNSLSLCWFHSCVRTRWERDRLVIVQNVRTVYQLLFGFPCVLIVARLFPFKIILNFIVYCCSNTDNHTSMSSTWFCAYAVIYKYTLPAVRSCLFVGIVHHKMQTGVRHN